MIRTADLATTTRVVLAALVATLAALALLLIASGSAGSASTGHGTSTVAGGFGWDKHDPGN